MCSVSRVTASAVETSSDISGWIKRSETLVDCAIASFHVVPRCFTVCRPHGSSGREQDEFARHLHRWLSDDGCFPIGGISNALGIRTALLSFHVE